MLTGIAFLLGAALLGTGLVHASISLRRFLSFAEQILWGLVIGWLLTTLAIYCVARIEGRLHYGPVLVLTVFEWILALSLWFKLLRHVNSKENNLRALWRRDYVGIVVLFTVFGLIYLHLFSTHMLAPAAGGIYSGGSTWYDMSFHAALTSSFLYGQNFSASLHTLAAGSVAISVPAGFSNGSVDVRWSKHARGTSLHQFLSCACDHWSHVFPRVSLSALALCCGRSHDALPSERRSRFRLFLT